MDVVSTSEPLPESVRGSITVSIDLEDWHQLVTRRFSGQLPACSANVDAQTDELLGVLDAHGLRATFFVLGLVARERPELVKRIAALGHEIASHGVEHHQLFKLDRAGVRAELRDSKKLLSDVTGQEVAGFRAAEFSIVASNCWALEELAEAGYRYDSSIYPIVHRRYGIADFPRSPARVSLPTGALWELPIGTLDTRWGNLPIGGGGYFRLLPGLALETAVRHLTGRGEHVMLYFHPYEFSRERLSLGPGELPPSPVARLRAALWIALQGVGRGRLRPRAERTIDVTRAIRAIDLVDELERARRPESTPKERSFRDARN